MSKFFPGQLHVSVTDNLAVFTIPWLIIPELNMKGALKCGFYFTFLLGTVNIAVCLVRCIKIITRANEITLAEAGIQ
jgi:hypothetical protein